MSSGPLPSTRCLLSELPSRQVREKVRFLGCVTAYSMHSARLTLEHQCPKGSTVKASVDVKLLLQVLKSEQTDIGQWVHVIGYITSAEMSAIADVVPLPEIRESICIGVQALVIWEADGLDIASYEKSILAKAD
ncbi:Uu.00g097310.m01.CDS01 [Anthostomella pinea]|uniref:Uu.00g097310.m01.CDS01 n=1 Tax=Anthostomella pinea TaxID=933095 RepID=A0AAI8YF16_9PEZI|nr:Uu.00g097310.m01.CDS01 [Anthostomella pinea]